MTSTENRLILLCSVEHYECAHIIVETDYGKNSKRRATSMDETIGKYCANIKSNEKTVLSINKSYKRTHLVLSMREISKLLVPQRNSFINDTVESYKTFMNIHATSFLGTVDFATQTSIGGDVRSNEYNNRISNALSKYLSTIGHEAHFVLVQRM